MPRPRKCCQLSVLPPSRVFKPKGIPLREMAFVELRHDELEALSLADYQEMEQEVAAQKMGISRPTFSRLVNGARKKVAQALVEGHALRLLCEDKTQEENKKGDQDASI